MTQDAKSDRVELSEEQLYGAIHRLCHFVPIDSADNLCNAFQEFLVQHAMAALGVNPLLPSEVRDSLKNLFGLDFELREVEIILERLRKIEEVAYIKEKYRLDFRKCTELRQSVKDCEDFEKKVIDDWLKSVENQHPELSQDDLQRLEKDLKIFAAKIFEQHGVKCATLIYAKQKKIVETINNLEVVLSDILPEYPVLDKIRNTELPAFFRDAKGERRKYIAELLDSTFLLHAIQVDRSCSVLIKRFLKGRLLYLDTNVLYALFDLHIPPENKAVKRLIELSQQMGYTTVVSTKTLEEFKYSLNLSEKNLRKYPEVPKDLAKVAANYSEGGFIPAYWRKHAETSIPPEDFIATYRNFEELLAEYKIEIRDDLCVEVQEDSELNNQIDMLYASADPIIIDKSVAEHDAFHRLLIKKLRGGKAHTFSDAPAWFLTLDKKLNRYDYFARSREETALSEVPFCILCDDWLQFIRPLLPRTDDFDKTFIALLSSPHFRSYGEVPTQLAEKIIGRLTHFENFSPKIAAKMLTDSLFIRRLETTDGEKNLMELIDNKIVASAEEFRIERDQYKKQSLEAAKTVKRIEEEKKRIKEELEKQRSEYLSEKEKYEIDKERLEKKLEDFSATRDVWVNYVKWAATGLIWIFVALTLILIPWGGLVWGVKILVACVAVFGSLMALVIPLGWREIFTIIVIIGAVSHIVVLTNLVVEHLA